MNENLRLDYLSQLDVTSWMPRQPLPGARPSVFFYHEAPRKASFLDHSTSRLRRKTEAEAAPAAQEQRAARQPQEPALQVRTEETALSRRPRIPAPEPVAADTDPMAALAVTTQVNRVPEHLQLVFIRQQGNRPLIISHFGERGDSEQVLIPLAQGMLQFAGFNEPLITLPFAWPLPGMPAVCREQEFVQVFRALLGGARLGCTPKHECWWFGELPELIAENQDLLTITLHHPVSLSEVLYSATEKKAVLYRILGQQQELNTR